MSPTAVPVDREGTGTSLKPIQRTQKSKDLDKDSSKLRSACDGCHAAKVRCTGDLPCARCARDNLDCHYSCKAKIGKPRGSMNKKTIERLRQMKEERKQQHLTPHTPPPTNDSTTGIPPLPSCDEDSTFSPLQSPPNLETRVDCQSPASFILGSFPFQESILPENGLDCMENWLPTIPDESMENANFPLLGGLTGTHNERDTSNASSVGSLNGSNMGFGEIDGHKEPAKDMGYSMHFPCSPRPSRCNSIDTNSSNGFLADQFGSFYLGSTCHHSPSGGCFATLSNHLCTLQSIPQTSEQARAIDILLIQSQRTIPSVRSLFNCRPCMRDPQALLLVNMVLARLLRWTHMSICAYGKRCVSAEVRLGKYQISGDFGHTVARMLIQTHLADLKTTVNAFAGLVSQTGHGKADGAYLSQQAKSLEAELGVMAEKIQKLSSTGVI